MYQTGDGVKPRLRPIQIPWQVSPSTPFLRLITEESAGSALVELCADFGPRYRSSRSESEIPLVVEPPPHDAAIEQTSGLARYRWMRLKFDGIRQACLSSPASEHDVIDEARFDWTELASARWAPGEDPVAFNKRMLREWMDTAVAPDPGFYEVADSSRVANADSGPRHFLIRGHDAYIEVVANGYTSIEVRDLPDW
jgi:hypothetical protein